MKNKFLPFFLTIAIGTNSIPATILGAEFKDILSNPYRTEIERWTDKGILFGMTDTEFEPEGTLTRAQIAAILNRINVYKAQATNTFTDIKTTDWFYLDILKSNAAEVFVGNGDGTMTPNMEINCESAIAVFARAFGVPDSSVTAYPGANVSSWAANAVNGMKASGYLNGLFQNGFNPKRNMTRAETIKLLDNCLTNFITTKGAITKVSEGNVLINTPNVTLKDITINGNLIIAEGVGEGDIILDNVEVTGKTMIRGGGLNSIIIYGKTKLPIVDVYKHKQTDEISIKIQDNTSIVDTINVLQNSENVHIYGPVKNLNVNANATVVGVNATLTNGTLFGENSAIILDSKTTIRNVSIDAKAKESKIELQKGAKIDTLKVDAIKANVTVMGAIRDLSIGKTGEGTSLEVKSGAVVNNVTTTAPQVIIKGDGLVEKVTVSGNDTKISTLGTLVTVISGATGVIAGDKKINSGESITTGGSAPSVEEVNKGGITNNVESSDSNLSTTSKIKGIQIGNLGTPSATITNVIKGAVALTPEQSILTTGTNFIKSSSYAKIKVVKYTAGNALPTVTEFTNAIEFNDNDIVNQGDFFVIKVTAEDGTVKYYIIDVLIQSATIDNTTVAGTIYAPVNATNITVRLNNNKFIAINENESVNGWINNLPQGLNAKVAANVLAGDTTINITITGVPSEISTNYINIIIPANKLQFNAVPLTVDENINAKFNIIGN